MTNSASLQDMMHVAISCHGYTPIKEGFVSTIGSEKCKSCRNCENLRNEKCQVNLYDKVLTSLDQT